MTPTVTNWYCPQCMKSLSSEDVQCRGWSRVEDCMLSGVAVQDPRCGLCGHPVERREQKIGTFEE